MLGYLRRANHAFNAKTMHRLLGNFAQHYLFAIRRRQPGMNAAHLPDPSDSRAKIGSMRVASNPKFGQSVESQISVMRRLLSAITSEIKQL